MKKTTKMSRTVGTLEGLYNHLNQDFFENKLPVPIITVQSKKGSMGHCTVAKVWKRGDGRTYEMNICADVLDYPVEETIDTMLHEMVHLYCRENDIKEVSRGGVYHNKKFKELAEKVGLVTTYNDRIGFNTVGSGNERLIEYALSIDFYGFEICRKEEHEYIPISILDMGGVPTSPTGSPINPPQSSTRKYQCPQCKNSFRATKDLNVICGDCNVPFIKVTKN